MQYVILGVNPVPWTPSRFSKVGKRVQVYKPAELEAYQEAIRDALEDCPPCQHERIDLRFFFWRKAGSRHDHRADATNLQKALEDAIQGRIFVNDRNVVHVESWVVAQHADVDPLIVIQALPASEPPTVASEPGEFVSKIEFGVTPPPDPALDNVEDFF